MKEQDEKKRDVLQPAPTPKKKRKTEREVVIAPSQPGGPDLSVE
jgi:hypothetical protein